MPEPSEALPTLRLLGEHLDDVVWVSASPGGEIVFVSPSARRLLGIDPDALLGDPGAIRSMVHPDDQALFDAGVDAVRRGEVRVSDYRMIRQGGEVRHVRVRDVPVEGGGAAGIASDVTDGIRSRERWAFLAEVGRRLQSALGREEILDGFAEWVVPRLAAAARIHLVDPEGRRIRTRPPDSDRGEAGWEAVETMEAALGSEAGVPDVVEEVLRSGEARFFPELPPGFPGGGAEGEVGGEGDAAHARPGPRSALVLPVDARDRRLGVITLFSAPDRRFEEEDLRTGEELASRTALALDNARLLNGERRAREDAEQASRSKSEFLAVLSHEVRTPLNAMVGYCDLLESEVAGPISDKQRRHVRRIRASAWHLLEVIEEVLALAKAESGHIELEPEEVGAAELAEEVADLLRPQAHEAGLLFRVERPPEPIRLVTDPARLRQILVNLLSNAVKFTERGGVFLSYEAEGERIRFHVRDTGPGVPEEDRASIFRSFTQGSTNPEGDGSGLGLAVARRFARVLGGDIEVTDAPGGGAVFTVSLPRHVGEAGPAPGEGTAADGDGGAAP